MHRGRVAEKTGPSVTGAPLAPSGIEVVVATGDVGARGGAAHLANGTPRAA
ncbi:MAG TPA: hypothetical protein VF549_06835 [Solirubrobacteraceae bacterium]|jgi:hypothetical protein